MHEPRVAYGLAILGLCALIGCSMTPSMDLTSAKPVDLSGRWMLDRKASDDVRARLLPLIDRKERGWQRDEQPFDDLPPQSANASPDAPRGEVSTIRWMQQRRQREAMALISTISPGGQLDIRQTPSEIRISSDKGEGSRTLTPGRTSGLFTAIGGFEMSSGWQGTTFVIDSRGTGENHMHVVERYTLIDGGAVLEAKLETKLPDLGKHAFRFIYRRN